MRFKQILKTKYILLGIILLATVLRFWQLGTIPPSPDWDEVAYGYNAYSILNTGADEYGVKFPVVLKSYGDYKPALYSYLAVPSVAILGLNPFAVRFPNAFFSVLGVLGVYFLVKEIFKDEKLALISSFFLAVSPWQIQFTRFSHEATVAVTLNILAILFFLKGIKKYRWLIPSAIFLSLTLYSYQSEKIFIPFLFLILFILFFKDIIRVPKNFIFASFIALFVIAIPMLFFVLHDRNALSRAQGTSIFAHQTEVLNKSAKQLINDRKNHNVIGEVIHNRRFVYAEEIVKNYLVHFSPQWLFITGDQSRHHPPGMGILYLWDFPFIILGIYYLLKKNLTSKKNKLLIFFWFFISPIAAAITYDVPHAGRTMNFLPIFQIFTAIGVFYLFTNLKKKIDKNNFFILVVFISSFFIINFTYYLRQYFVVLDQKNSEDYQYGYQQTVSEIEKIKGAYNHVIVSNQVPLDESYMFFLFYLKYPPQKYQYEEDKNHSFNKFTFRAINYQTDSNLSNVLLVGSVKEIPQNASVIQKINYLDGKPAIIISRSNK